MSDARRVKRVRVFQSSTDCVQIPRFGGGRVGLCRINRDGEGVTHHVCDQHDVYIRWPNDETDDTDDTCDGIMSA